MILMDAYGCTRCQQIFVLQDNGYIIEQVSTIYPYKRCYTWNGHRWKPLREKKRLIWLIITIMMALPIIVIFIPLVLIVTNSGNLIVSIALVMVMLMILIFWLFA